MLACAYVELSCRFVEIMARVSACLVVVVALALVILAAAEMNVSEKRNNAEVVIHNTFRSDNITIQCDSDFKKDPTVHLVHPG